jgi:hypothetical protein
MTSKAGSVFQALGVHAHIIIVTHFMPDKNNK